VYHNDCDCLALCCLLYAVPCHVPCFAISFMPCIVLRVLLYTVTLLLCFSPYCALLSSNSVMYCVLSRISILYYHVPCGVCPALCTALLVVFYSAVFCAVT
jgi:hypothetical protein